MVGRLQRAAKPTGGEVEVRRLALEENPSCLSEVLALVDEEKQREDSLLSLGRPSFYGQFFPPKGVISGAFSMGRLVGFGLLGFSSLLQALWEPYVAAMATERRRCGILYSVLVELSCRGEGVGRALVERQITDAEERGVRVLFATVHPGNVASLRMLDRQGFSVIGRVADYSSRGPRLLMCRDAGSGCSTFGARW